MVPDEPEPKPREPSGNPLAQYLRYSGLGMQFFLSVGLLVGVGIWLDQCFGTVLVFTIGGLALGFTLGTYTLYKTLYRKGIRSRKRAEGRGKDAERNTGD